MNNLAFWGTNSCSGSDVVLKNQLNSFETLLPIVVVCLWAMSAVFIYILSKASTKRKILYILISAVVFGGLYLVIFIAAAGWSLFNGPACI